MDFAVTGRKGRSFFEDMVQQDIFISIRTVFQALIRKIAFALILEALQRSMCGTFGKVKASCSSYLHRKLIHFQCPSCRINSQAEILKESLPFGLNFSWSLAFCYFNRLCYFHRPLLRSTTRWHTLFSIYIIVPLFQHPRNVFWPLLLKMYTFIFKSRF